MKKKNCASILIDTDKVFGKIQQPFTVVTFSRQGIDGGTS